MLKFLCKLKPNKYFANELEFNELYFTKYLH